MSTSAVQPYGPYPGRCVRIVDGDTLDIDVDLGFAITLRQRVRLVGSNAPEARTAAGKRATAAAVGMCPPGTPVQLLSYGWDKYGGRCDGVVRLPSGSSLADELIRGGYAVVWDGTGVRP